MLNSLIDGHLESVNQLGYHFVGVSANLILQDRIQQSTSTQSDVDK